MNLNELRKEIKNFIPHLILWSRENDRNDRMGAFTALFNYFTKDGQTDLLKTWNDHLKMPMIRVSL